MRSPKFHFAVVVGPVGVALTACEPSKATSSSSASAQSTGSCKGAPIVIGQIRRLAPTPTPTCRSRRRRPCKL